MTGVQRPSRCEGLEVNQVADGLVVYQAAPEQVHYLNNTSAVIFELCEGHRSIEEIAEQVQDVFSLPAPPGRRGQSVRLGPGGQGGREIAGFRLLWHQVELDTGQADPTVAEALRYLVNGAEHHLPALAVMHYSVTTMPDGSHVVSEEGDTLEAVDSADGVLDLIYRRVHQRAFELASLRGWVRLHAAVVDGAGGRTLIVAPSGTGKTTLSCRLLLDGAAVAADESVMIRDGIAAAGGPALPPQVGPRSGGPRPPPATQPTFRRSATGRSELSIPVRRISPGP